MQVDKIKPLRLSASIILPLEQSNSKPNLILMLVRKPHMSFENSLVFPGGVCDREDETFSNSFHQFSKITAIRELLQETGILLLPPGIVLENIEHLRGQYAIRQLKKLNSLILVLWQKYLPLLIPIARFITPQFPKMSRFDCIFYLPLPTVLRINLGRNGTLYDLNIHVEESSKYFWATPEEYLEMKKQGKVFLPPPQYIILKYLARVGKDVYKIRPEVQPFVGQFISNGVFALPGDKGYDYDRFAVLEPKSRTSEQLSSYIHKKKLAFKEGDSCHLTNLTPLKRKEQDNKEVQIVFNVAEEKQKTIIAYLLLPEAKL